MSEESLNQTPANPPTHSASEQDAISQREVDPFEEHRQRRASRRAERRARRGGANAWVGGAILIIVGLILMAQNLGVVVLNNWWALFILIPAVGSFGTAWRRYQAADGLLTSGVIGSLIGGCVLGAIALAFLFNLTLGLNWNLFWPLMLIVGGLSLLLQAVSR
jgi:cation transport ATPase